MQDVEDLEEAAPFFRVSGVVREIFLEAR